MSSTVLVIGGFVLLVLGGEGLVRGAVSVARRLGVSPLLIGLTLVGFGTSTPELVTSMQAALAGSSGIAVGNVVGSNIANILLILGLTALIRPVLAHPVAFGRDGPMVVLAAVVAMAVTMLGVVSRTSGLMMVLLLIAYVTITYLRERKQPDASADMHTAEADAAGSAPMGLFPSLLFLFGGMVLVVLGARLLIDGAVAIAAGLGVSDTLIGLTMVAVGTSLPELTTSIVAAVRGQGDVAFGNIIGSNIVNVLGVLGVVSIVTPIAIPAEIAAFDIWVMLGATAALVLAVVTGWRVSRREGAVLLLGYAAYLGWLAMSAGA
ncbi:calcium/sodium antiporter [Roseospira navarrensis]|uniref:Calcium/sodium antiporter n=1 Tax=Roseospira navarrensis TaxID=140058 RepID=A0A7X1ZD06_9PROT|nr:calcium/sodium antiporter [Roseospira navarrensis]MQX35764.1 calcium/sodium antiporter [Roseospira navarrensis]